MGRPRRFDEQALLDCALEVFWSQGYDRTSIEDISVVSGVGNGSLYAAYGSKLDLFLAVFERYCDARVEVVRRVIDEHRGDFESAIAHYLDEIVSDCTSHDDRRGCLMLNSVADLGARFPAVVSVGARAMTAMDGIVAGRVAEAVAAGDIELQPEEVAPLGSHIVIISQGLIQLSRIGVPVSRLRTLARAASRTSTLLSAA